MKGCGGIVTTRAEKNKALTRGTRMVTESSSCRGGEKLEHPAYK